MSDDVFLGIEGANNVTFTCNEHRGLYETLESAVDEIDDDEWATPSSRDFVLLKKTLWIAQVYPDTPVGFWRVAGSSFPEVLFGVWRGLNEQQ